MPFDGSGTFNRVMNWVNDAAAGLKIRADRHDTEDNNLAAGLSMCLTKDGQTTPTGDIKLGGHKLINVGDPANPQDAVTVSWISANLVGGALIADTPPAAGKVGNLWWESDTGNLFLKYDDGDTVQWVQVNVSSPAIPDSIISMPADMEALFRVGSPNKFVVNTKPDGTGTDVMAVGDDGSLSISNNIACTNGIFSANGWFIGNGTIAMLAATGAGTCFLRPNGYNTATGQFTVDSTGAALASGQITATGGVYSMGSYPAMYLTGGNYYMAFNGTFYTSVSAGGDWLVVQGSQGQTHSIRYSDKALIHLGPAYKPGGGSWADSSDERIKNVLGEFDSGLDQIKALRPIRYTFKGNDTDAEPSDEPPMAPEEGKERPDPKPHEAVVPYLNSPHYSQAVEEKQYVGFIAQEVEKVMPGMVTRRTAYIDGEQVTDLRDLDTTNLIYALVNAVKELAAKVEALEAR